MQLIKLEELPILQTLRWGPKPEARLEVFKGLEKLQDFRQRILPANPLASPPQPRKVFQVCVTQSTFVYASYIVMGVTLEGLCWYTQTNVSTQVGQWKKNPFSHIVGDVLPTSIPWLMCIELVDRRGDLDAPPSSLEELEGNLRSSASMTERGSVS